MPDSPSSSRLPLALACGGSFLAFLDVTIANLAVPDLSADLGRDIGAVSWIVTLYAALFAALLIPAGRLADVLGRRRLYIAGVLVFTAASAVAALSPGLAVLLVARAAQGVGAAALIPASLAFVLADTPPERRAAAIGLWSASAALAAVVGPAVGGVVVDLLGWRALFWITVPAGLVLLAAARRARPDRAAGGRLPDAVGVGLLTAGVASLVLAVTEGPDQGWGSAGTVAAAGFGVAALCGALARSVHHPSPAVPVGLWRTPVYRAANATSVLFGAALYVSLLLGVLFLTAVWEYSELRAGLAMVPGAVSAAVVGVVAGRRGLPPRATAAGGAVLLAAAFAASALWVPETPHFLAWWLPIGLLMGAGIGGLSVGASSAAALAAPPERFAAATGLNLAARQVGGALGVAGMTVALDGHPPGALDGYTTVYALCAGVTLLALLPALRLGTGPEPALPAPSVPPRRDAGGARMSAASGPSERAVLPAATAAGLLAGAPWRRLAVLGDSVTAGIREPSPGFRDLSAVDRIAEGLAAAAAAAGGTLERLDLAERDLRVDAIRERQLARALAWGPDLVIVSAGGNDALGRGFDADAVRAGLEDLVGPLAASGAQVVTVGLFDLARSGVVPEPRAAVLAARFDALEEMTAGVAAATGALHTDAHRHPSGTDPALYASDLVHCNAYGHAVAAELTVRALAGLLAGERRAGAVRG